MWRGNMWKDGEGKAQFSTVEKWGCGSATADVIGGRLFNKPMKNGLLGPIVLQQAMAIYRVEKCQVNR